MTVSVVNHKGGTGKTTSAINIGSALCLLGHKVLLVDFDAQGSLTYSLGIADNVHSIANVLHGEIPVEDVLQQREGMDVLPAGASLADAELSIAKSEERFHHLRNLLTGVSDYDFVLIDCPPSLSLLTLNALVASDYVIIPMQMDVLSLRGLDSMLNTMQKVNAINPSLKVLGVLPIMVDTRKNIHQEIRDYIRTNYDVRMLEQSIRTSVKAAEAPSFGKSVLAYASSCTTSQDYVALAKEIAGLVKKRKRKLETAN